MNDDGVRDFIRGAGTAPPPTEVEWEGFRHRAHRSLLVRRTGVALLAAAAVLVGVFGGRTLVEDRALPPVPPARHDPRPPAPWPGKETRVAHTCAPAPEFQPRGERGALVYFAGEELRVRDLTAGEEWPVVAGVPAPIIDGGAVGISPDGRWVTFGEGFVAPALGGDLCRPLGEWGAEPAWTASGTMLAQGEGVLVTGSPTEGLGDEIHTGDEGDFFFGKVMDPARRRAAFVWSEISDRGLVQRARLAVLDVASGEYEVLHEFAPGLSPAVEAWSPDGRWVVVRNVVAGAAGTGEPAPLIAIEVASGRAVEVGGEDRTPATLTPLDRTAWCENRLVIATGTFKFATRGGDLVMASPPEWRTIVLAEGGTQRSYSQPSCRGPALAVSAGPFTEFGWPVPTSVLVFNDVDSPAVGEHEFRDQMLASPRWVGDLLLVERWRPGDPKRVALSLLDSAVGDVEDVVDLGRFEPGEFGRTEAARFHAWLAP